MNYLALAALLSPNLLNSILGLMMQSPSAQRNKAFIGEVLADIVKSKCQNRPMNVFEVASGTGEHAHYFNSVIPNMLYQPSEPDSSTHASISEWTKDFRDRVLPPIPFDITTFETFDLPQAFENDKIDIVICINMIHISPFECTSCLFRFANSFGNKDAAVLTYGPYAVEGRMVESNQAFDRSLRARNPLWGVRSVEEVQVVAGECGFRLGEMREMPANNLCLVFVRK